MILKKSIPYNFSASGEYILNQIFTRGTNTYVSLLLVERIPPSPMMQF